MTTYLKTPSALVRYRSSLAGPHLDGFVGWLETKGINPTGSATFREGLTVSHAGHPQRGSRRHADVLKNFVDNSLATTISVVIRLDS
jgi:hypothetical protein